MATRIRRVLAREILDSRGLPTLEVELGLSDGATGRAAVPSGASTGEHEALELRDGDARRYGGKGVRRAAGHVLETLGPALAGRDPADQQGVDETLLRLDGTPNKSRLGANALLGVSMAAARAGAASAGLPLYEHLRRAFGLREKEYLLPVPMLNVVNGGRHADNGLDVQEFMVVPSGAASFSEALRLGAELYQALKRLLAGRGLSTAVGDEGGFAPRLRRHEEVLEALAQAARACASSRQMRFALDAAASEFRRGGKYRFEGRLLSASALAGRYRGWAERHPIVSIEDPFDQDDWGAWKEFTREAGGRLRVVGDDLFVTRLDRLERGVREGAGNAILIKLNQVGTVTETVRAVLRAREAGFSTIISHRSGETEDTFIADLAVALNAGAIKAGAPCRSERLCKYNQLLRIEEELGRRASFAGGRPFGAAAERCRA